MNDLQVIFLQLSSHTLIKYGYLPPSPQKIKIQQLPCYMNDLQVIFLQLSSHTLIKYGYLPPPPKRGNSATAMLYE